MNTQTPAVQIVPGPVFNAETALSIGLRAIEERFGRAILEKYELYEAVLIHKEWIVTGNNDLDGNMRSYRKPLALIVS